MTTPIQGRPRGSGKTAIPKKDAKQSAAYTLPYAPSANRYWRNVKGRMILSAEARSYRERVANLMAAAVPMEGEIEITLNFFRPQKSGDLDGRLKQLLDALQGFAYVNDSQIVKITATRYDDKNNPRVEILVEKMTPQRL